MIHLYGDLPESLRIRQVSLKKNPSKKIHLSWRNGQDPQTDTRTYQSCPQGTHQLAPLMSWSFPDTQFFLICIVNVKQASQILLAQIFLEHQFLLFY